MSDYPTIPTFAFLGYNNLYITVPLTSLNILIITLQAQIKKYLFYISSYRKDTYKSMYSMKQFKPILI